MSINVTSEHWISLPPYKPGQNGSMTNLPERLTEGMYLRRIVEGQKVYEHRRPVVLYRTDTQNPIARVNIEKCTHLFEEDVVRTEVCFRVVKVIP